MKELQPAAHLPVQTSFENAYLRFVSLSRQAEIMYLYGVKMQRMAGATHITRAAAEAMTDEVLHKKAWLGTDCFYEYVPKKWLLTYLWCSPIVAVQRRFN